MKIKFHALYGYTLSKVRSERFFFGEAKEGKASRAWWKDDYDVSMIQARPRTREIVCVCV